MLSSKSLINLFTILDHNDFDLFFRVIDLVNNTKVTDSDLACVDACELFGSKQARVFFELAKVVDYLVVVFRREAISFP